MTNTNEKLIREIQEEAKTEAQEHEARKAKKLSNKITITKQAIRRDTATLKFATDSIINEERNLEEIKNEKSLSKEIKNIKKGIKEIEARIKTLEINIESNEAKLKKLTDKQFGIIAEEMRKEIN